MATNTSIPVRSARRCTVRPAVSKLVFVTTVALATSTAFAFSGAAANPPAKTAVAKPHGLRAPRGWTPSERARAPRGVRSHRTTRERSWSYDWPIKPFDRPHPVRAYFDDPRIVPGLSYSFHFGVDIGIPKFRTAVYAIRAGRVHMRNKWAVSITSGHRRFEYWHIVPAVHEGQWVPRHAFLGRTKGIFNHVHLSEFVGWRVVNPLRPGGIGPYRDDTAPTTDGLSFRKANSSILRGAVHGSVQIVADSYDTVPEVKSKPWPVTPAVLRWRIVRQDQVLVRWQIAYDFRSKLYAKGRYHSIFATGTRMNHPSGAGHYCFYLAQAWSSADLPDGSYVLEVAAADLQGNASTSSFDFEVAN